MKFSNSILCFCGLLSLNACYLFDSNKTSVAPVVSATELRIYSSGIASNGNKGNRATTNAACETAYTTLNPAALCNNFVSLLGYTTDNGVQDLPANAGFQDDLPILTFDDVEVAADYADLLDDMDVSILGTGIPDASYYNGFLNSGSPFNNCDDWTDGTLGAAGRFIIPSSSPSWSFSESTCDQSYAHLCLCWE